jgi:transposase
MKTEPKQTFERYIAIDSHKFYVVVGGIDAHLEPVLPQRHLSLEDFREWAPKHLVSSDAVVIEASTNTWVLYDLIAPLVGKVVVVHPPKVKLIAAAAVKTDKIDVFKLAKLLLVGWLPEVWVPPQHVRDLRALISHRWRLVRMRTATKNRLHSVLQRNAIRAPRQHPFAQKHRSWWEGLEVTATERLRVRQDLENLDHLGGQIAEVESEIQRLSTSEHWVDVVPYAMQLSGLGMITTMTILAAIGDISRFSTAKKLVGYAGLGASVHDSGLTHRKGHITKAGRKEMRWALVEAAWAAVRYGPYWKGQFQALKRRMHPNQAIVAIARKMLVVLWHLLSKKQVYRQGTEEQIVRKMLVWSWKMDQGARLGLTRQQFARYALMHLGVGAGVTRIAYGGTRRIASVEEVLALRPELGTRS